MAQLTVQVTTLDLVDSVSRISEKNGQPDITTVEDPADFFSMAGLWEGRETSLESIRQQAWPRQVGLLFMMAQPKHL